METMPVWRGENSEAKKFSSASKSTSSKNPEWFWQDSAEFGTLKNCLVGKENAHICDEFIGANETDESAAAFTFNSCDGDSDGVFASRHRIAALSGMKDGLGSPPQPLPPHLILLNSPTSSSRPSESSWKKGLLLGIGTFGHVYHGFNTGQICAIEEIKSNDSHYKESLKQLNQELKLLGQLSHANIVQYYGSELVDDTLLVYLEYVSGDSIYMLLKEYGSFGEPIIKNYTAQILSGLVYLHGKNTVHRDIKGANILVNSYGEVKLVNFGIAKHIPSDVLIPSLRGSPYWMAPEVIMNKNGYNLSADIWSLGCTVLEMATSRTPWSRFALMPVMHEILFGKDIPDIPDRLSSEAKSFVMSCLQRDPSNRPTAGQLMDHPFVRDQAARKYAKLSYGQGYVSSI